MQAASERSRWWVPLYSLGLGAIVFAAFALGGNAADGARAFAPFVIVAAASWFGVRARTRSAASGAPAATSGGRRSTCGRARRRVRGDPGGAGGVAGRARRQAGRAALYGQLLAVGGIAYIAAIAFLRRRG